ITKRLRDRQLPHIIQNNQASLVSERLLCILLRRDFVRILTQVITQRHTNSLIQSMLAWCASRRQPEDAIGESESHFAIMRKSSSYNALANTAHALNGGGVFLCTDECGFVHISNDQFS